MSRKTHVRLHASVDHDLDEHRLACRNRVDVSGSKRVRGFDTMTPYAECLCQRRELNRRIDKIHADKAFGAMEQPKSLLDDSVTAIVEHEKRDRQFLMGGGPERLDRIHGAAVSKQGDHLAVGPGELDADRGGDAPTDPAADIAEIAVAVAQAQEGREVRRGGQSLVDDN